MPEGARQLARGVAVSLRAALKQTAMMKDLQGSYYFGGQLFEVLIWQMCFIRSVVFAGTCSREACVNPIIVLGMLLMSTIIVNAKEEMNTKGASSAMAAGWSWTGAMTLQMVRSQTRGITN